MRGCVAWHLADPFETFLLTLDLTNPDLNTDRPRRIKKGPLRTRWINPGLGRNRPGKYTKPATYSTVAGAQLEDIQPAEDDPEIDEEEEDDPVDEDGDRDGSPDPLADQGEIQTVELHSNNPLITYNGNAFSCQWASNVGTELLFKAHDRDSTIPVIRKLNGGVDLLAVNCGRIISNQLELQPRKRKRSPDRAFLRGSHISHTKYLIPIGAHASARRKDQAVFLERMIGIKAEKGEPDSVTVVAEKRLSNNKWRARFKEMRSAERKHLNNIISSAGQRQTKPEDVQNALHKLKTMDEEDARIAQLGPSLGKRRVASRNQHAKEKAGKDSSPGFEKPRRGRPPKAVTQVPISHNSNNGRPAPGHASEPIAEEGDDDDEGEGEEDDDNTLQHVVGGGGDNIEDDDEDEFYSAGDGE